MPIRNVMGCILTLVLMTAPGCGKTDPAPAILSRCSIASDPSGRGFVVTYTFVVKSVTKRDIIATRIGSQPWREAAVPIHDDETGGGFDDERRLPAFSSHTIRLRTSVIPGRRIFGPTPMACKVVAVAYADGTTWAARKTFVTPLVENRGSSQRQIPADR